MGNLSQHPDQVGELIGHCFEHLHHVGVSGLGVARLEELLGESEGTTPQRVHGMVGKIA
jgi:hypothetical protein